MTRRKMGLLSLGAVLLAALSLGAAYAYAPEDSDEAKQDFCESLSDLSSTVMSYEGLDTRTATIGELEAAEDDIVAAYDEVVDDAYDWKYAYDNSLTEAYDDLYYAIEDMPADYTVEQSLEAVEPELSAFPGAFRETFDGSGCTTGTES